MTNIMAGLAAALVEAIPLDLLDANPLNPRRTMNEATLKELAASIAQTGINQPLLVRPQSNVEGLVEARYEIVCGHRRSEAAALAGLEEVPCIVREMTDIEAAEIALVDNLQREDVGALEEAEAFGALLALHGTEIGVALRVGKEVAHVAKRLKLRALGVWQRDALRAKLITVDHALLLARLGVEEQDQALKWALDRNAGVKTPVDKVIEASIKSLAEGNKNRYYGAYWEPQSVLHLKQHIEESTGRKLSRAPWDLDDETLVHGTPACNACPSNTKANTSLFGDLAIEEATCADGGCFQVKTSAFIEIALKAVKGKPPLRVSWKQTSTEPRWDIGEPCAGPVGLNNFARIVKRTQIFKHGQWVEAKKGSCKHAEPAVTVDWSDDGNRSFVGDGKKLREPGETLTVCAAPKCKAHRKEYEKPKTEPGGNCRDEAAEKAAREKRKEEAIAESKLRMAVAAKALEGVVKLPIEALRALAIESLPDYAGGRRFHEALFPGIVKTLGEAKADSVAFFQALAAASIDKNLLEANEWRPAKEDRGEFLAAVKRLGYDGSSAWMKPAKQPANKGVKAAPAKPAKKAAKR